MNRLAQSNIIQIVNFINFILQWVKYLNLNSSDKIAIETDAMLNNKHMYAALKILKKQFPGIDGFQPTILCQPTILYQTNGFSPITEDGKNFH